MNPNFAYAEVKEHCNLWTGNHDINENGVYERPVDICDDWKPMGNPDHPGRLTYGPLAACPTAADPTGPLVVACPPPYPWGGDRSGGHVSVNEPSPSDSNVVWAGTSAGRIFITTNARAADPASIQWKRIDPSSSVDPARYPTDVFVDPSDPNHAYITYSGYNHVTPDTPGHIFEVRYNAATGTATFTSLDGTGSKALGDLPVGTIERDEKNGDLYIGTDFGVAQAEGIRERVAARLAGDPDDHDSVPEDRPGEPRHVRRDARLRRLDRLEAVLACPPHNNRRTRAASGRPFATERRS